MVAIQSIVASIKNKKMIPAHNVVALEKKANQTIIDGESPTIINGEKQSAEVIPVQRITWQECAYYKKDEKTGKEYCQQFFSFCSKDKCNPKYMQRKA
jgi:flagellar assembly factor FliW